MHSSISPTISHTCGSSGAMSSSVAPSSKAANTAIQLRLLAAASVVLLMLLPITPTNTCAGTKAPARQTHSATREATCSSSSM